MRFDTVNRWMLCLALAALLPACSGQDAKTDAGRLESDTHSHAAAESAHDPDSVALCAAHGAPANRCFICDASLRDSERLWCAEHARYEDRCWICHPELQDKSRLYCEEHGLYEDECFICHPGLVVSPEAPVETGEATELMCVEHGVPEAVCGICHPELAAQLTPGEGLKIRLPSVDSAARAGVTAQTLGAGPAADAFSATGELKYNLNRLARITTPVDGVVRTVQSDVGEAVKQNTALLSISSPRIAAVRADLIRALSEETVAAQSLERQKQLFAQKVTPARDLDDARARHESAKALTQSARQTLRDLGLTGEDVERFARSEDAESLLPLRTPFGGTVVERSVALGDVVEAGDVMFVVADLDVMWLKLSLSESDAARVRVGDRVDVRMEALHQDISGRITWVASNLDEVTRTVQVRAEIPNPDHALRAGTFVTARVFAGSDTSQMSIHRDALHQIDGRNFVFVRATDDLYELRCVEARAIPGDRVALLAGLSASDQVVTQQSYLVKAEFQKSRLGAGCVH